MSGSNINLTGTADLSQIDSAMLASAAAAQSMSSSTSESLNSLMSSTESVISALKSGLVQLQESYKTASASAKKSIQDHIESIEAQIIAQQSWVSVTSQTKTAFEDITVSATTTGQTLQQLINTTMGFDRIMASAADSSKIFATSLATQGVSATEAASAWKTLGTNITTLSGDQFGSLINSLRNVQTNFKSASSDGSAFTKEMLALGANITNLSGAQFGSLINSLRNVQTNFKSASSDGYAFAVEMQEIGQKIDKLTGAQFGALTNKIAGVRDNFKSASSDGSAFTKEMRDLGENVRTLASRDMQSLIARTSGLSNEMRTGSEIGRELASQFGKIEGVSERSGRAMHSAGVVGSGAMQELVRISRALLTGNLDRIPGEVMTLTTRLNGLSPVIMGVTGAIAGMSLVIWEAVSAYNALIRAKEHLAYGSSFVNESISKKDTDAAIADLQRYTSISTADSAKIINNISTAVGSGVAEMRYLSRVAIELSSGNHEIAKNISQELGSAFEKPATALAGLLRKLDSSAELQKRLEDLTGKTDMVSELERRSIMLQAVNEKYNLSANSLRLLTEREVALSDAMSNTQALSQGFISSEQIAANRQQAHSIVFEQQTQMTNLYADALQHLNGRTADSAETLRAWLAQQKMMVSQSREAASVLALGSGASPSEAHGKELAAERDYWQTVLNDQNVVGQKKLNAAAALSTAITQLNNHEMTELRTQSATYAQQSELAYKQDKATFEASLQGKVGIHANLTRILLEHDEQYWNSRANDLTREGAHQNQIMMAVLKAAEARQAIVRANLEEEISDNSRWLEDQKRVLTAKLVSVSAIALAEKKNHYDTKLSELAAEKNYWETVLAGDIKLSSDRIKVIDILNKTIIKINDERAAKARSTDATITQQLELELKTQLANYAEYALKYKLTHSQMMIGMANIEVEFWKAKGEFYKKDGELFAVYVASMLKMDEARIRLANTTLSANSSASKKSLQDQIADYSRRQAEAGKDFALVMQIEQEKLDFIRKAVGEKDRIYQNELKHSAELRNKHYEEEISAEADRLQRATNRSNIELQTEKKKLQTLVDLHLISQTDMLESVERFAKDKADIQIREWNRFLQTIPLEILLNEKVADRILAIRTHLDKEIATIDEQKAARVKRLADSEARMWSSAGDSIGNSIKQAMAGLINNQTTWQKATQSILKSMVTEFITMTGTMMARWALKELFFNSTSAAGRAIRDAQEANASNTGFSAMIIAQIRDWLGMETVKTAGTATNTTARTAILAAGETAGTAIKGTAAIASIGTDAAVGGAGAYASLASIPYIGPILGAAAAVAAIGTIMGYKSMVKMDVGAWDVPKDMPAYIHAGEMVVPRNFADGMRSGSFGATGNTGNQGGDTNQTNHFNFSPTVHGGTDLNQQVMGAYRYFREVGRNGALALPGRKA
jgi:hypothetical protein